VCFLQALRIEAQFPEKLEYVIDFIENLNYHCLLQLNLKNLNRSFWNQTQVEECLVICLF
jgi:hypothetical protein